MAPNIRVGGCPVMRGSTDGAPGEQVYFGAVIEGREDARRGEPTAMQTTTARTLNPAYERVLISRSSAGLPRTYRLVRRQGRRAALLTAVLRALR